MDRVPGYYGGLLDVLLAELVWRLVDLVMPDNARVAALLAGDIDIMNSLPVTSIAQVRDNPGTTVMTVNGTRYLCIRNAEAAVYRRACARALNMAVDPQADRGAGC